jgi:hypothetical protein
MGFPADGLGIDTVRSGEDARHKHGLYALYSKHQGRLFMGSLGQKWLEVRVSTSVWWI